MQYNELIDRLQNLINIKPSQESLAKILGKHQTAIAQRIARGTPFKTDDLFKLEKAYGLPTGVLSGVETVNANPNALEISNIDHKTNVIIVDKRLYKETSDLYWLHANGDSMSPVIENQDIVLVDTSNTDISNGGIFLFEINAKRFIKRLRLRVTGELDIISDNDKYPIETVTNCNELKVIGRAIKNLSRCL